MMEKHQIIDASDNKQITNLVWAVMVLCGEVERQERRIDDLVVAIARLEDAADERQAEDDLAFSVALYKPIIDG